MLLLVVLLLLRPGDAGRHAAVQGPLDSAPSDGADGEDICIYIYILNNK